MPLPPRRHEARRPSEPFSSSAGSGRRSPGASQHQGQLRGLRPTPHRPVARRVPLDRLRRHDLNRLYAERAAAGLSPTTIRRIHATLHRALRNAVRWGETAENPATNSDPPRRGSVLDLAVAAPEDVAAFLRAVEGDELEALWVVLVMTACGAALRLKGSRGDRIREQRHLLQRSLGTRASDTQPPTRRSVRCRTRFLASRHHAERGQDPVRRRGTHSDRTETTDSPKGLQMQAASSGVGAFLTAWSMGR